jgi:hypothetical protein
MRCQNCRRELTADEPVYRVAIGYNLIWRERWDGSAVGSLCAYCATQSPEVAFFPDQRWRTPEPCCHCGRPVILNGRRRIPHFIACGDRCRQAAAKAAAQWEISPGERACPACGMTFVPKRINGIYCSHACKQWVYRSRQDGGRGPFRRRGSPSERACSTCGVIFVPKGNKAFYCSKSCRQAAYRNRQGRSSRAPSWRHPQSSAPPVTRQD